jgi:kinesin family protein 5
MSTTSGTGGVSYRNGTQRSSLRTQSSASTSSGGQKASVKSKSVLRKSSPAALGGGSSKSGGGGDAGVPGRVRVAVRLRPRNGEELIADADFADCVELQPELKRLKLRKNNWDTDTFEFDEVLTEYASQKRVYEVVAKPVVEVYRSCTRPSSVSSFFLLLLKTFYEFESFFFGIGCFGWL